MKYLVLALLPFLAVSPLKADDIITRTDLLMTVAPAVAGEKEEFAAQTALEFPELTIDQFVLERGSEGRSPGDWVVVMTDYREGGTTSLTCERFGPDSIAALKSGKPDKVTKMSYVRLSDLGYRLRVVETGLGIPMPEEARQALSCALIIGGPLEVDLDGAVKANFEQNFERVLPVMGEPPGGQTTGIFAGRGPRIGDIDLFFLSAVVEFNARTGEPARADLRMIAFELAGQS